MELDEDADGFIGKADFIDFMKTVGEPLSEEEMQKFLQVACEKDSDEIDVKRLAKILLPEMTFV